MNFKFGTGIPKMYSKMVMPNSSGIDMQDGLLGSKKGEFARGSGYLALLAWVRGYFPPSEPSDHDILYNCCSNVAMGTLGRR